MTASTRDRDVTTRYEMVVGLEVHVQLRTRTKAFCNCPATFGAAPNVNTCAVCLGLPGSLPVLNAEAVRLATVAALALGASVRETSVFARKNYFYPDLPKGYQITQYERPLAEGGQLVIGRHADGSDLFIGLTRVHMEEDAGKSVHDRFEGKTAIDLNRAGVPLIEIVTEPQIRSPEEAGTFLRLLKQLMQYLDVSDANMEEGSLRVDANTSVRLRGETRLGIKTEIKNMNSFSAVERALEAEFVRQCAVVESGDRVVQQTMLWDGHAGEVRPARAKEGSQDYRYFPEPDLAPLILTRAWCEEVKKSLPELPRKRRERFSKDYVLSDQDVELLTASPYLADYYESVARQHGDAKAVANWMNDVLGALNATGQDIRHFSVRPADMASLLDMVREGTLSRSAAKTVFSIMVRTGDRPEKIAERERLMLVSDEGQLARWVDEVIAENPDEARRLREGERKLQGVLVGLVMKKSQGRAEPKRVNQLLAERSGT